MFQWTRSPTFLLNVQLARNPTRITTTHRSPGLMLYSRAEPLDECPPSKQMHRTSPDLCCQTCLFESSWPITEQRRCPKAPNHAPPAPGARPPSPPPLAREPSNVARPKPFGVKERDKNSLGPDGDCFKSALPTFLHIKIHIIVWSWFYLAHGFALGVFLFNCQHCGIPVWSPEPGTFCFSQWTCNGTVGMEARTGKQQVHMVLHFLVRYI